jgi:hypothetical protein
MQYYNRNSITLLQSIYPNYAWNFSQLKIQNQLTRGEMKRDLMNDAFYLLELHNYLKSLLKNCMKKYHITQKKDWYRVPLEFEKNERYYFLLKKMNLFLYDALKLSYPNEKWRKSNFLIRTKKTSQRLLFSQTQKIYPSLLIIEDYHHPKLILQSSVLELDLFIPSLELALEYQGEHHYDDIPSGFAGIDLFQVRDKEKESLTEKLSIKLICIPYWWDQSLSSLQSSLQSSLNPF